MIANLVTKLIKKTEEGVDMKNEVHLTIQQGVLSF